MTTMLGKTRWIAWLIHQQCLFILASDTERIGAALYFFPIVSKHPVTGTAAKNWDQTHDVVLILGKAEMMLTTHFKASFISKRLGVSFRMDLFGLENPHCFLNPNYFHVP